MSPPWLCNAIRLAYIGNSYPIMHAPNRSERVIAKIDVLHRPSNCLRDESYPASARKSACKGRRVACRQQLSLTNRTHIQVEVRKYVSTYAYIVRIRLNAPHMHAYVHAARSSVSQRKRRLKWTELFHCSIVEIADKTGTIMKYVSGSIITHTRHAPTCGAHRSAQRNTRKNQQGCLHQRFLAPLYECNHCT